MGVGTEAFDEVGEKDTRRAGGAALGSRSERSIMGKMVGSRRTERVIIAGECLRRRTRDCRVWDEEAASGSLCGEDA